MRASPPRPRFPTFLAVTLSVALAPPFPSVCAADPPVRITIGWGVDTSSVAVREIVDVVRSYLSDRPDSTHRSPYWSSADQTRWKLFDFTAPWVYQSRAWNRWLAPTVVEVSPLETGKQDVYVVRFLLVHEGGEPNAVRPLGLVRLHAVREEGRWVLANATSWLTSRWRRVEIGGITFLHPPERSFDRGRARRAADFADSLARVFSLPRPQGITYFVADSPWEMWSAIGLDFAVPGTTGRAYAADRIVFSGEPVYGEFHAHELAHVVTWPIVAPRGTSWILGEGFATWLGGTRGVSFPQAVVELAAHLEGHPDLTLLRALQPQGIDRMAYASSAILFELAYEQGGIKRVRELIRIGPRPQEELLREIARVLDIDATKLDAVWKETVARVAARAGNVAR